MIRLPDNLATVGESRLRALDAGTERELQREVARMRHADKRFDHALTNALAIENEMILRGMQAPDA